jgi:Holliday junction resolvase RusA-like endonuclease
MVKKVPIPLNKVTHTELKLTCPYSLKIGKKRIPINLNWYRNAHFRQLDSAKKQYLKIMQPQLKDVGIRTPVKITVCVFKPTKRILDKHNVDSVTKKFLYDALTNLGVWADDNDDFVKEEITLPTIYDKNKERVEVLIESI